MLTYAEAIDPALAIRFDQLADRWKEETAFFSSTTAMVDHPDYREIIGIGEPVVPLLLEDLRREPAHWFEALQAITGENPVPGDHRGNIPAMCEDWLEWGRQRKLV